MLVAYGPNGRSVVAEDTPLEQLLCWSRERLLYCPNCRGMLHVRGGPEKRTQLHFAHQRGECAWSTETESVRHVTGKIVLSRWLHAQFPDALVTLEERLPEPNRIADVFVAHADGTRWAIEFQCAPLDVAEWRHRHTAYRNAQMLDIWIIGNNRHEKQEAFIEAILTFAHEILFVDPLVTPPHIWLRWPVTRATIQAWQNSSAWTPSREGWVGHLGYGATLSGQLQQVSLGKQGELLHPFRSTLEKQMLVWQEMSKAPAVDEAVLASYLRGRVSEEALSVVLLPLLRSYLRDPDLLRRYNYGRGRTDHAVNTEDQLRVQRARQWLLNLQQKGFSLTHLQELTKAMPFVGPYTALVGYMEMLLVLWESSSI